VRAYNVSVEQVKSAREQARLEGLSDRVEFVQDDWRNIAGCFDAFVSIGMLEHVGPENYSVLGHVIQECLHREGRGLIHTIAQDFVARLNPWIERRIFPGAQPPALEQLAVIFSAGDLTVHDVENLRLHYAETLAHWLARFERSADTVRGMYDETFVRTWRMYLASSYSAFMTGSLQLFQVLFAPAPSNELPRTRAPLYRNADHLA
jgi:cyclopropane-fatty-acyl-phospholipid synthase